MSLWTRIKRAFRFEVSQLADTSATDDYTEPLDFVSELITGEYTDPDLWQHKRMVAMRDPIMHRVCVLLSHNVFDDWFTIMKHSPDAEDADEQGMIEHDKNTQIQEELKAMDAKHHFTQALIGERIYGQAALCLNMNLHRTDVLGEGYQVAALDVFTEENSTIPTEAYDMATGLPDYIVTYPNAQFGHITEQVYWEDIVWWCTRPKGRSIFGYPAGYAIWDLATYLRESTDAMAWVHKKLGAGVWIWYAKGSADTQKIDALQDTLQDMSSRRAIIAEMDQFDKVEWTGPPASGTDAIVKGNDFLLGMISAGSGIPKDIFTGVSAGAITGSEINNKALYATINKIQSDITPYVLATIVKMGYDITDMVIEWNTRYATDELEQAQIRLLHAQAAQLEAQAEQGMGPNDMTIGFKAGEDPNQEQNPTGVQS